MTQIEKQFLSDGGYGSLKKCAKCLQIRDYIAFYRKNTTKDGYSGYCRMCRKPTYQNVQPDISISEKQCPKCEQMLPTASFGTNRSKKDGYATYCKPCSAQRARKIYKENPSYRLKRALTSRIWHEENYKFKKSSGK